MRHYKTAFGALSAGPEYHLLGAQSALDGARWAMDTLMRTTECEKAIKAYGYYRWNVGMYVAHSASDGSVERKLYAASDFLRDSYAPLDQVLRACRRRKQR